MRWLFAEDSLQSWQKRQKTERLVAEWWLEFRTKEKRIAASFKNEVKFDLPEWMDQTLCKIDRGLNWEYGPAVSGKGHRLVITPEADRHLRPLSEYIVSRAPKLEGWEFYTHRLAEDVKTASALCEARAGLGLDSIDVVATPGKHNRIDLRYIFANEHIEVERAGNVAFLATETLLGEEMLDKWIGYIDTDIFPDPKSIPLERLKPAIQTIADVIMGGLPKERCFKTFNEDDGWSTYKLKKGALQKDYADRDDVIAGGSCRLDILNAAGSSLLFYSSSFSRHSERFCYLKIDGSEGLDQEFFKDRGDIEDAVHKALMAKELGCYTGGATGRRYSYVDLVLTDVKQAIPVIKDVLVKGKIPNRTWLLFHDSDWVGEWVGIYPNTPAPPQPEKD